MSSKIYTCVRFFLNKKIHIYCIEVWNNMRQKTMPWLLHDTRRWEIVDDPNYFTWPIILEAVKFIENNLPKSVNSSGIGPTYIIPVISACKRTMSILIEIFNQQSIENTWANCNRRHETLLSFNVKRWCCKNRSDPRYKGSDPAPSRRVDSPLLQGNNKRERL